MKKGKKNSASCEGMIEADVLRAQLETALAGILVVGSDQKTLLHNKKFSKLWGIPGKLLKTRNDKKMIGFARKQLKDPDYFIRTTMDLYKHPSKERLDTLEFKDGRYFERYSSPLRGGNNRYYGRIWYFRDISEKKRLEIKLKESESKCRMIFDNIDDIVFLANLEDKSGLGTFFDMNRTGCRRLGYTKKELSKKTPWQVVTPSSSTDAKKDLARIIKEGRAVFEREMVTKKGDVIQVEMSVRKIKYDGRTLLLAIARDIEKRKETQVLLQNEKNKLQRYLEVASVLAVVFDSDMKIITVNGRWQDFFGVKARRSVGLDWVESFVSPSFREETRDKLLELSKVNHGTIASLENSVVLPDGGRRDIFWRFALMPSALNDKISMLGIGLDITEFKKAKATIGELKELNRLKDEFLNIATHELKTPLTSIIGLSEVLIGQNEEMDKQRSKYLKIIHEEGLRLAHTMRQMLEVARYESGRFKVINRKMALSKVIRDMNPSLSVLAKGKDFKIIVDRGVEGVEVESDEQRIAQVIYDLVDNAAKHSGDSTDIRVILSRPSAGEVKVEVTDNGIGISEEMQGRLFSKFFQLNPSLSRHQEGIGLGLYSCKLAVESLGGTIGLESSPGKGANFHFTIPINRGSE